MGKTTLSEELAQKTGLHHLSINEVVKKHSIGESSNDPDDPNTKIVDEVNLCFALESCRKTVR